MSESNWGRWGSEDQRGALNTIDNGKVVEAAKLVRQGRIYNLAIDLDQETTPFSRRRAPVLHLMSIDPAGAKRQVVDGFDYADDFIVMPVQSGTHVDALCHIWEEGKLYNGFSSDEVTTFGAERLGVEQLGGIVTRGLLLDVAGFEGRSLSASEEISAEQLARCAAAQNLEVMSGDAVLIRTGWMTMMIKDRDRFIREEPGIGVEAAQWLARHDVALVGCDNMAVEPLPFVDSLSPVHRLLICRYGIPLLELVDLETIAKESIHEFLFVLAPLPLVGATGSPVRPLAIV